MRAGVTVAVLLTAASAPALAACNNAISIFELRQMNYGTIAVTNGGGRVTIAPSGVVTAPGGFALSGATVAGNFVTLGSANCAMSILFTPGSLVGPGSAMTINNFTTDAGASPRFNGSGWFDFNVGADLLVNASQAGGNYSGTYTVTVIY